MNTSWRVKRIITLTYYSSSSASSHMACIILIHIQAQWRTATRLGILLSFSLTSQQWSYFCAFFLCSTDFVLPQIPITRHEHLPNTLSFPGSSTPAEIQSTHTNSSVWRMWGSCGRSWLLINLAVIKSVQAWWRGQWLCDLTSLQNCNFHFTSSGNDNTSCGSKIIYETVSFTN